MGKNLKGWALAENILGKERTDRLRSGKQVDVVGKNGMTYRMHLSRSKYQSLFTDCERPDPVLINMTTMEKYCFHPDHGSEGKFPEPDWIICWYEYITKRPEAMEKIVGGEFAGHRTKIDLLQNQSDYIFTLEEIQLAEQKAQEQLKRTQSDMLLMVLPEYFRMTLEGKIKYEIIREE